MQINNISLIALILAVLSSGCATAPSQDLVAATAQKTEYAGLEVKFKQDKESKPEQLFNNVRVGDHKIVRDGSEITISSIRDKVVPLKISISSSWEPDTIATNISATQFISTNERDATLPAYRIAIKEIENNGIKINHNDYLKIEDESNNISLVFRRQDDTDWWPGVYSPILTKVSGDPSLFELNDFAPSIAIGIVQKNDYAYRPKISALVTMFPSTKENEQGKYSLALGPVVNFGGWLDIGYTYHFGDKKGLLVFGTTPQDLWQKIMPSSK